MDLEQRLLGSCSLAVAAINGRLKNQDGVLSTHGQVLTGLRADLNMWLEAKNKALSAQVRTGSFGCGSLHMAVASSPAPKRGKGKGQVEVMCTKRKLSEHASSIGSDEQNLDIPKRLESSQAPRANEPNCVAVAQYASSTCTTAAQGLQDRGKRMIFVSSKQCAVPGVSWHKRGAWQVSWREKNERKYKNFNVQDFMKTSETFCRAEADALSAAIKFRKSLEKRGVGMAKRVQNPQSNVPGVNWHRPKKAWMVQLQVKGKRLSGGCFKPKDSTPDEVECARLAAVESRRKLEQKYFKISRVENCFA